MMINNLNNSNLNIKQFTAIDSIIKLTVANSYASANSRNASLFLKKKILKVFSFDIKSIQMNERNKNKVGKRQVYLIVLACRPTAVYWNEVNKFMKYFKNEFKENNRPPA